MHKRVILLFLEPHTRRQWCLMPMHMCISSQTPQAEHVDSLRSKILSQPFTDTVNQSLKLKVLRERKLNRNLLSVFFWSDQHITLEGWKTVQEGNGPLCFCNKTVLVFGIAAKKLADETVRDSFEPRQIKRHTFTHCKPPISL